MKMNRVRRLPPCYKSRSIINGILSFLLLLTLTPYSEASQNKLPTHGVNSAARPLMRPNIQKYQSPDTKSRYDEEEEGHRQLQNRMMSRSAFLSTSTAAAAAAAAATAMMTARPADAIYEPSFENSQIRLSDQKGVASVMSSTSNIPLASGSKSSGLSNSQQESISGFVAGASLSTVKTLVKFPLDTATVRLQIPNSGYTLRDLPSLFRGSYSGVTLSLLSNIPGGAVFFAVKDATKASLKASDLLSTTPRWFTTSIAVATALIPYWAIRNPSEVVKVRQQVGFDGYGEGISPLDALQTTISESDGTSLEIAEEFYTGYGENILYGLPADVIKFVAYEAITDGRKDLAPIEGAAAGAFATAIAQLVTTPLDVIRNRLMTGKDKYGVPLSEKEKSTGYIQSLIRLAKDEGSSGFFAGSTPRVAKAFLSGAIQFATYEETKQSIAQLLQR